VGLVVDDVGEFHFENFRITDYFPQPSRNIPVWVLEG
jgi:hypothetical protein